MPRVTTTPRGLSRRRVQQRLRETRGLRSVASRIDVLSCGFLGCPYQPNPLIGSADTAEVFTVSLDGFDCVTYIETVLALSRASDVDGFIAGLRKIRYEEGRIRWERRNHYMTAWISNNVRNGIIGPVSARGVPTVSRVRILNMMSGLPPQRIRIKCIPKAAAPRLAAHLETGDLIFFVSTRMNLDVFHAGIVVRDGNRILLRHASRSRGSVVEQGLTDFMKTNRMSGVIAVRPADVIMHRG